MKPYTTSDLGLAAYLYTCGYELLKPIPTKDEKRFSFVFVYQEDVEELADMYFRGDANVPARDYFANIKKVRNTLKEPYHPNEADN